MIKIKYLPVIALSLLGPAASSLAQDVTPLTTKNGCHRFTLVEGAGQLAGTGLGSGVAIVQRGHDGRLFTMDFESWGAGTALVDLAGGTGGADPLVFINWSFRENRATGTERGRTVVLPPDPESPTEFPFHLVSETVQGNRYRAGGLFALANLDVATGTFEVTELNILWCRANLRPRHHETNPSF